MKNPKKVKMGKASKAAGQRFEKRVREDLESKGWIVDKWTNNVEFNVAGYTGNDNDIPLISKEGTKLIPAKHKFRGPGIPMAIGTGFPDFIIFHKVKILTDSVSLVGLESRKEYPLIVYDIIGVESKMDGKLDKIEKEKCGWLLDNQIFSRILIASKSKEKRGEIVYNEFKP